jgi:hypothetical protein
MGSIKTALMVDINEYVKTLNWWSKFCWAMFSPCKWWVRGYERGWNAALREVELARQENSIMESKEK